MSKAVGKRIKVVGTSAAARFFAGMEGKIFDVSVNEIWPVYVMLDGTETRCRQSMCFTEDEVRYLNNKPVLL